MNLTHVNDKGEANMVDISKKEVVHREARAYGRVKLSKNTIDLIKKNNLKKGDVLSVSRIAGINGGKKTSELIPLTHNIPINKIDIDFKINDNSIEIFSYASCDYKTGIEMEALTAVSIAALTIYDMVKAADKSIIIEEIRLESKIKQPLK